MTILGGIIGNIKNSLDCVYKRFHNYKMYSPYEEWKSNVWGNCRQLICEFVPQSVRNCRLEHEPNGEGNLKRTAETTTISRSNQLHHYTL